VTEEYDDDPRGQHIYSPEASDTQRFGDWQTRLAVAVMMLGAAVASLVACHFQQ